MNIKKHAAIIVLALCSVVAMAQERKQFDPHRFESDLEQYITTAACLTPAEASAFFPVYREMRCKQMAMWGRERRMRHIDTSDDRACAEAIRKRDANELESKRIQQSYHERFMTIISASKVFRVLKAEDDFHRQMFKKAGSERRRHKN